MTAYSYTRYLRFSSKIIGLLEDTQSYMSKSTSVLNGTSTISDARRKSARLSSLGDMNGQMTTLRRLRENRRDLGYGTRRECDGHRNRLALNGVAITVDPLNTCRFGRVPLISQDIELHLRSLLMWKTCRWK